MVKAKVSPVVENDFFARGTFEARGTDRGFHELSSNDFSLDTYGGLGTFRGKPIATLDEMLPHIVTGRSIDHSNNVITYTFNDVGHLVGLFNNPQYGFTAGIGFSEYSPSQQAAAREAISMWDDLIPQTFREINGMGADIVFSNSSDPDQAYAYYPLVKGGQKFASDVFTRNPSENWTNEWFTPGGYGNTTLIHEIGHTVGLSHPGKYNGAAATTYLGQAEYAQDSMQYTIMSYWAGGETGASTVNWTLFLNNYAQTPMLHDIYAIQSVYGADKTTRTGDTVYGFGSTAGHAIFNFAYNPFPYLSVYDAGGTDTIDLSGFTASQFLDLHAGSFSSIGAAIPTFDAVNAARIADDFAPISLASYNSVVGGRNATVEAKIFADTGVHGIVASEYDNFSIAYGVTIENANGGSGKDVIYGNEVANVIHGNGGDDVIRGYEGHDTLYGDAGNDTLFGDAGNDILIGGEGNDILIGGEGNDTLTGGAGNDTFVFDNLEMGDVITDFGAGDMIDLSALGDGLSYIGNSAFSGAAGEVRFDGGVLSADVDGGGVADFMVTLQAGAMLNPDQLVLHA